MSQAAADGFAAGAGVNPADLRLFAASAVAVAMLLWTAWIAYGHYIAWRENRLELMDVTWGIVRAAILTLLLGYFIR